MSRFLFNKSLFFLRNRRSNKEKGQELGVPICSNSSEESKTIYKTVDFAKTNALNRTKRDIESEREQAISEHTIIPTNIFSNLTGGGVVAAVGANLLNRWLTKLMNAVILTFERCQDLILKSVNGPKTWHSKNMDMVVCVRILSKTAATYSASVISYIFS